MRPFSAVLLALCSLMGCANTDKAEAAAIECPAGHLPQLSSDCVVPKR